MSKTMDIGQYMAEYPGADIGPWQAAGGGQSLLALVKQAKALGLGKIEVVDYCDEYADVVRVSEPPRGFTTQQVAFLMSRMSGDEVCSNVNCIDIWWD